MLITTLGCVVRAATPQPVVSELVDITWTTAATGFADDPKNLANDRVWVYSAMNDTIVATSVVKATEAYCAWRRWQGFVVATRVPPSARGALTRCVSVSSFRFCVLVADNSFLVDPTKQMLAIYDHVGEHAQVTKYWGDDCMSLEPPYMFVNMAERAIMLVPLCHRAMLCLCYRACAWWPRCDPVRSSVSQQQLRL